MSKCVNVTLQSALSLVAIATLLLLFMGHRTVVHAQSTCRPQQIESSDCECGTDRHIMKARCEITVDATGKKCGGPYCQSCYEVCKGIGSSRLPDNGSRCISKTSTANSGFVVNTNKAVKISDASLEIKANCEAVLHFTASSLIPKVSFPDSAHAPAVFVTLMQGNTALVATGGETDAIVSSCGGADAHDATLHDSGVTPDRLNAATTFSLRMSGASGHPCQ